MFNFNSADGMTAYHAVYELLSYCLQKSKRGIVEYSEAMVAVATNFIHLFFFNLTL